MCLANEVTTMVNVTNMTMLLSGAELGLMEYGAHKILQFVSKVLCSSVSLAKVVEPSCNQGGDDGVVAHMDMLVWRI